MTRIEKLSRGHKKATASKAMGSAAGTEAQHAMQSLDKKYAPFK